MKAEGALSIASTDGLEPAEQERLACILDDYLVALERGAPISPEELLDRHPADAEYLRSYLSGLKLFHAVAGAKTGSSPTTFRVPRRAGQTIGDFELVREIGRGGMGVVYEAVQLSLKRRVALKVLPFTGGENAKQIARFKNEAQAAALAQHPNIVPVFAIGEEEGLHYYAMQLVEGQSLAAMVEHRSTDPRRRPALTTIVEDCDTICGPRLFETLPIIAAEPLPALSAQDTSAHIRSVASLAVQAARALHAAHEYGVIHRDVKPSNLLVDDAGKLWVTDFGLARCRENSGLTQTGDILGTVRYMSPEQALGGATSVDPRSDVYSLGVTLYELATFTHPAENAADVRLFFDRMRSNCKPLRHWNRFIPCDFETIVLKAIAELPEERYRSACELADDLQRFLDGKPIQASRPSAISRVMKWTRRHRVAVYTAAGVLAAGLVGLLVSALLLISEKNATAEAHASNFQQATAQIDRNIQLGEQLAAIPGAQAARRQLYQQSIEYYRRYAAQAASDSSLSADLALTYSKIAGLTAKVGDRAAALKFHEDAERIVQQLAAANPSNPAYARSLALCRNNRGLLLSELGRTGEALALLRQAEDAQIGLQKSDPTSRSFAADLATTYSNLGLVLGQQSDQTAAAEAFEQAIATGEELITAVPDDAVAVQRLAACYANLASIQCANGVEATASFERAIDLQRRLLAHDQLNPVYQSELARTYNNLGYVLSHGQRWGEAEVAYHQAIVVQESLVAEPYAPADYLHDVAVSYNNLGMVQSQRQDLKEAEASFKQALKTQQRVLAIALKDWRVLNDLGGMHNNLAQLLDKDHRADNASQEYQRAIEYQRQAFAASGGKESIRELLSKHYYNFAANLGERRQFEAARAVALERRALWPNNPERLCSVAEQLMSLSRQAAAAGAAGTPLEQQCVDAAVNTLQAAVRAGLSTARLQDRSLAALASHPELQKLRKAEL